MRSSDTCRVLSQKVSVMLRLAHMKVEAAVAVGPDFLERRASPRDNSTDPFWFGPYSSRSVI
jgi:hypothetical protein